MSSSRPLFGGYNPNQRQSNDNEGWNRSLDDGWWSNCRNNDPNQNWWSNGNGDDMSEPGTTLLGMGMESQSTSSHPHSQKQRGHFSPNNAPDEMDVDISSGNNRLNSDQLNCIKVFCNISGSDRALATSILEASDWDIGSTLVNISLSLQIKIGGCSDEIKQQVIDTLCTKFNLKSYAASSALIKYNYNISSLVDNLTTDTPGGQSFNTLPNSQAIEQLCQKFPSLQEKVIAYILRTNEYDVKKATMVAESITSHTSNRIKESGIKKQKIDYISSVTRLSAEKGRELLEGNDWDVQIAVNSFFTDGNQLSRFDNKCNICKTSQKHQCNTTFNDQNILPDTAPSFKASGSSIEMIENIVTDVKKKYDRSERKEDKTKTPVINNYYDVVNHGTLTKNFEILNNGTVNKNESLIQSCDLPQIDLGLGKLTPVQIERYINGVNKIHTNYLQGLNQINRSNLKLKHTFKLKEMEKERQKKTQNRQTEIKQEPIIIDDNDL